MLSYPRDLLQNGWGFDRGVPGLLVDDTAAEVDGVVVQPAVGKVIEEYESGRCSAVAVRADACHFCFAGTGAGADPV